ncbi:unnamed protein product [Periconia digitata]|uniref:Uncharacterized protein n=1 Tax=Periconia digitata TaxID=1303443 RepID=A0A9W4UBF3_9PLEO|nr:unnamed protein product [Periconia digitata]
MKRWCSDHRTPWNVICRHGNERFLSVSTPQPHNQGRLRQPLLRHAMPCNAAQPLACTPSFANVLPRHPPSLGRLLR